MENAVEALKIAFAVMMFVVALTLSISSFSQARSAASSIINMSDRETEYTYVKPSSDFTRTVGVETIVTSMYRAYEENIEIYFFKNDNTPLILYYKTDDYGNRVKEGGVEVGINYINLALEKFPSVDKAREHLNILLGTKNPSIYAGEYKKQLNTDYTQGLYHYLGSHKFEESQGEYYQGTGTSKIKKRVITYKIVD